MKSKIGFSSRYYEPFQRLEEMFDTQKMFDMVYNEDRGTYSFPYLYDSYKNKFDPNVIVEESMGRLTKFLQDNLFNETERKLLLEELTPTINDFGTQSVYKLTERIVLKEYMNDHLELLSEFRKSIDALKRANIILNQRFSNETFMSTATEPVVFISYSHDSEDHKNWVLQLSTRLRSNGINVILDRWNLTLGRDLASFMERGLSKSQRIVCICSEAYVRKANDGKGGVGYEKQIMTAELINDQNTNWVIPLIKNNQATKKTPTFLGGRLYIDFEDPLFYESKYEELLRDLLGEAALPIPPIGPNPFQNIKNFSEQKFFPSSEKYVSPATQGIVTFDYSNNNGKYCIGQAELMFEIAFSKASETHIHLYNDPPSINTIAIAKGITEFKEISDARLFDGSSRVRHPRINQIAILQNANGFYAAIKILSIKDDTRGDADDEIGFEYYIQTNGSPDFTK